MARPIGYQCSDKERDRSQEVMFNRHQKRRDALGDEVEPIDPAEIKAGVLSAVREGRVPPRYVSEIIRLMPIPLPEDEEEEQ